MRRSFLGLILLAGCEKPAAPAKPPLAGIPPSFFLVPNFCRRVVAELLGLGQFRLNGDVVRLQRGRGLDGDPGRRAARGSRVAHRPCAFRGTERR